MKTQFYLLFIAVVLMLNTSCQNQKKEKELMSVEKIYIIVYDLYPVDIFDHGFQTATESYDKLDSYYRNKIKIRGFMELNKDYSFNVLKESNASFLKLEIPLNADRYASDSLKNRINKIISLYPTDTIIPDIREELMIHSFPFYIFIIEKSNGEYIHIMSEIPGRILSDIDLFDYQRLITNSNQSEFTHVNDSILQTIDFLKHQIPFGFLDKLQGFPVERLEREKLN